jgi:hypothetical protein
MAKSGTRKVVKPVAAAAVTLGTIASIWWFALKPRRKAKHAATVAASSAAPESASGTPETD